MTKITTKSNKNINPETELPDFPVFFWLGADAELLGLTGKEFSMKIAEERKNNAWRNGESSFEEGWGEDISPDSEGTD